MEETVITTNVDTVPTDNPLLKNNNNRRKYYLDVLRIIACFLVIVNHTNSQIFLQTDVSLTYFVSVTYMVICRIAVPLYVMISGALLLKKEESYKDLFLKRILRIVLDLIIASFVYYLVDIYFTKKPFSFVDYIYRMYQKPMVTPLWYLYMYLGLMIMLPLLRKLVKNMSDKDFLYIFIIHCVFIGVWPIIQHYLNLKPICSNLSIPLVNTYIIWFIMGYFIENRMDKRFMNRKILISAIVCSLCFIVFSVMMMYYDKITNAEKNMYIVENTLINILIPSLTVFYAAKYISLKPRKKEHKYTLLKSVSSCTFGIYLIHPLFSMRLNMIFTKLVGLGLNKIIAVVIFEIFIFVACYIITFVLKKIPGVKKLL